MLKSTNVVLLYEFYYIRGVDKTYKDIDSFGWQFSHFGKICVSHFGKICLKFLLKNWGKVVSVDGVKNWVEK